MRQECHTYDDIIDLPHHVSQRHPQMSMEARAAQFAPFAALSGYEDVVHETARLTDPRAVLAEDARAALDEALTALSALAPRQPQVTVRYFLPDARKKGGAYRTATGFCKRIDAAAGLLLLTNGTKIPLAEIWQLEYDATHPGTQTDTKTF